jgi:hypothetical protein
MEEKKSKGGKRLARWLLLGVRQLAYSSERLLASQGELLMEANNSDPCEALKKCKYLWEEYKYRHDLIWQRVFRFTTAIVLISIIAYVQQDIVHLLGHWILLSPLLASILASFVFVVMWNELELFGRIKEAYRRQQNELLDDDLKHRLYERSNFRLFVLIYLATLVLLSVINGFVVSCVWIPKVLAQPICPCP